MNQATHFLSKLTIKKIILKLDEIFLGRRGFNFYSSAILDRRMTSYKKKSNQPWVFNPI